MAVAVLVRSRGVAGVTKSLFLIVTLMCLVGFASSLTKLEEVKETLKKLEREVARKKADNMLDRAFISDILEDLPRIMDPTIKMVKTAVPDFPPLGKLMEDLKEFIEASKGYIMKDVDDEIVKIEDRQINLMSVKELVKQLEKKPHEL